MKDDKKKLAELGTMLGMWLNITWRFEFVSNSQGPHLLTWINFDHSMDK